MSQIKRKRRLVALANVVARHLRVDRAKAVLFPAVASALGQPWPNRISGYVLVGQYAELHQLTGVTSQLRKDGVTVAKKSAPSSTWTPPKRVVRFAQKDDFLQTYEWRRLRMVVLTKRGNRCECCGASPSDGHTVLNVDHIKPRKLFPNLALDESNLQVLCAVCNHGKGNWDQTDWRSKAEDDTWSDADDEKALAALAWRMQ
jgi:5-methylcytosine-specific restriction endonuclease McrA